MKPSTSTNHKTSSTHEVFLYNSDMLVAPHFLIGTAIAVYAPEAGPAALAAITSHFVLDSIPHRDTIGTTHINLGNIVMEIFDITITALIFWWIVPAHLRGYALLVGGAAILPDLLAIPSWFWPQLYRLPVINQLHSWHVDYLQDRNGSLHWFWGLLPQVLIILAVIWLIKF